MDTTKHLSKSQRSRASNVGPLQKFRQYARSITGGKEKKDVLLGPQSSTIHASTTKDPALLQPVPRAFDSNLLVPWIRETVNTTAHSSTESVPFASRGGPSTQDRVASVNSLLPLSNAFRGTIYGDLNTLSSSNPSPTLSPRFMKPRPAPQPPQNSNASREFSSESSNVSTRLPISEIIPFAQGVNLPQCTITVPSMPSSPDLIQGSHPSTESGLERIGVALLECDQSSDTRSLNDASQSSLVGSAHSAQSLSAVFDALEGYGINARDILDMETERDSPFLSCSMSAPACLIIESPRSATGRYNKALKGLETRDSLAISFSSTMSNLETLLQNQGVDTLSSKRLIELWKVVGRQSIRPSHSRERARLPVVKEVIPTDQHRLEAQKGLKEAPFAYDEEYSVAADGSVGVAL